MRNVLLLVISFIFCLGLKGQYDESEANIATRYRPGIAWFINGFGKYEAGKLRKYDRLIVDITYCDWYGDREYLKSPWNSIGFNAALMFDVVLAENNTFSFGWGLGFSHYNNRTDLNLNRDFVNGITTMNDFPQGEEPFRNKFGANYLEIPLDLRFRTAGFKHFKFMIGGKIGYQLNAFTKVSEKNDGRIYTSKAYNFADVNKLRYGATVRIGIRNWAIYGAYYFSPLFTNSESVQLTPFTLGLSISLF